MRKRFKYLSHLPLTCDIVLCEIYLNDIVSSATFKKFKRMLLQPLCIIIIFCNDNIFYNIY